MRLPASTKPYVFGLLLSGLMSLMVSGVATCNAVGIGRDFVTLWLQSWVFAWSVAFPTLLIVRPFVQRLTDQIVVSQTQN
ncbi:MAG: DUF2798 domain-containing protein [Pseudomonadota bacterium]